jgi:hypothetical protein
MKSWSDWWTRHHRRCSQANQCFATLGKALSWKTTWVNSLLEQRKHSQNSRLDSKFGNPAPNVFCNFTDSRGVLCPITLQLSARNWNSIVLLVLVCNDIVLQPFIYNVIALPKSLCNVIALDIATCSCNTLFRVPKLLLCTHWLALDTFTIYSSHSIFPLSTRNSLFAVIELRRRALLCSQVSFSSNWAPNSSNFNFLKEKTPDFEIDAMYIITRIAILLVYIVPSNEDRLGTPSLASATEYHCAFKFASPCTKVANSLWKPAERHKQNLQGLVGTMMKEWWSLFMALTHTVMRNDVLEDENGGSVVVETLLLLVAVVS